MMRMLCENENMHLFYMTSQRGYGFAYKEKHYQPEHNGFMKNVEGFWYFLTFYFNKELLQPFKPVLIFSISLS